MLEIGRIRSSKHYSKDSRNLILKPPQCVRSSHLFFFSSDDKFFGLVSIEMRKVHLMLSKEPGIIVLRTTNHTNMSSVFQICHFKMSFRLHHHLNLARISSWKRAPIWAEELG